MIERYEYAGIADVWNTEEVLRRWHQVEAAHVGQVVDKDAQELLLTIRTPTPPQVAYYEAQTGHDVLAFLKALDDRLIARLGVVGPDGGQERLKAIRAALHYGLTSSDVVDTAMAMGLQETGPVVDALASKLQHELLDFADSLDGETVGRTHGQLAAKMPARHRWDVLGEMLDRTMVRTHAAFGWADVGKLSGPVGTFNCGGELALLSLGLRETNSTQIVPRDWLAHLGHCLAEQVTLCEAIATQVWTLAQAGVNEIRVSGAGVTSSSAMPHKRNPIAAETIRGLARLARSMAETLQLGIVQWGEHDMAHSSVERVVVPDLLHLTCTVLHRTASLVSGLAWEEPTLPPEYVDSSETLRAVQSHGTPYTEAHANLMGLYRDGKITANTEFAPREDSGN